MLIQAQCQHDREKRCKITANDKEIKNAADEAPTKNEHNNDANSDANHTAGKTPAADESNDVEMLDLDSSSEMAANNGEITSTPAAMASNAMPEIKTEPLEMEQMDEDTSKDIKIEDNDEDDLYSKDIAIEPRTYCKLGHFHLLLEDYPKGKLLFNLHEIFCEISISSSLQIIISIYRQPYQHIKNSIVWKRTTGRIHNFAMALV